MSSCTENDVNVNTMKTCVVFGGTRGIGASIANCFFNHQYNVAVFSRHQEHVTKFLDCYKHKDPKTLHIGNLPYYRLTGTLA